MINSEKDFESLEENINNAGSGCLVIFIIATIIIVYQIVF